MRYTFLFACFSFVLPHFLLQADEKIKDKKISYEKDLIPLFKKSCFKCHGAKKQKGTLRLDNVKHVKRGSKNGPVAIARVPEESNLYTLTILSEDDDDVMPSKGDLLNKQETELIKLWIAQGAQFEDGTALDGKEELLKKEPRKTLLDKLSLTVPAPNKELLKQFEKIDVKVKYLSLNKTLIDLDFSQVKKTVVLDDDILFQINQLSEQLVGLDFGGVNLTSVDLKFLQNLKNLKRLHLEKTGVGNGAMVHVKNLKNLEYLNLYDTDITDKAIKDLQSLTKLKALYLWKTKVSEEAVKNLKKKLPTLFVSLQ